MPRKAEGIKAPLQPDTRAFSAFLGLLVAVPTLGIDMVLPSLSATAAGFGVPAARSGLSMSVYLLSLGGGLLVWGPLADRFGRKAVIAWGCGLLIGGSTGCMLAGSFTQFLACRALQGVGASAPGMAGLAIVRDLFDGERARAKMSFVVGVINVVPMIAPSIGAVLLALGGWRLIHAAPIAVTLILLFALRRVKETAPAAQRGVRPIGILRNYVRVLQNPICLGNALCNAAMATAVFAYITGSSLVFIGVFGVSPAHYGLIFGATSLSVMGGAFLNSRLTTRGIPGAHAIALGLGLASCSAGLLLIAAASGSRSPAIVVAAMSGVALAFGLVSPNAVEGATRPHPAEIAGAVSAVAIFLQMVGASIGSDLVARFFDGRSPMSMAGVMLAASLIAIAAYIVLARPAELRTGAGQSALDRAKKETA